MSILSSVVFLAVSRASSDLRPALEVFSCVREICQDKYGMLWIGTEDGGLNRLSPMTNQMEHFLARGRPTDITYPNIHGLLPLGDTLLIGTFEHGLDMMDIRSGKVFAHSGKFFAQGNQSGKL